MNEPVSVEIIAYAPTAFYHCQHCEVAWKEIGVSNRFHDEQVESSLPADLANEYQAVSDWVRELLRQYCDQVVIKVIDATSVEGVWKSFRYGVHRYPAVILNHKTRFTGDAFSSAGEEISRLVGETQAEPAQ